MNKKQKRRINLEHLIEENRVYCTKHQEKLSKVQMYEYGCWNGYHGRRYCRYLRIDYQL